MHEITRLDFFDSGLAIGRGDLGVAGEACDVGDGADRRWQVPQWTATSTGQHRLRLPRRGGARRGGHSSDSQAERQLRDRFARRLRRRVAESEILDEVVGRRASATQMPAACRAWPVSPRLSTSSTVSAAMLIATLCGSGLSASLKPWITTAPPGVSSSPESKSIW